MSIQMSTLHWGYVFSYLISNCGWGNERVTDFAKHMYDTVMSDDIIPLPPVLGHIPQTRPLQLTQVPQGQGCVTIN